MQTREFLVGKTLDNLLTALNYANVEKRQKEENELQNLGPRRYCKII